MKKYSISVFKGDKLDTSGSDVDTLVKTYQNFRLRKLLFIVIVAVALVILCGISVGMGQYEISFAKVYECIWNAIVGGYDTKNVDMNVVVNQRLPRLCAAIIVGFGLAAAGAAMQSMLKNPLADPYTTGISSGASFGATVAIGFGIGSAIFGNYSTVVAAFACSLVPAAVILLLAAMKKCSPAMMILAGISIMYIFNALTSYFMLVMDEQSMATAYEWTLGTLSKASWSNLPIMFAIAAAGSIALIYMAKYLNAMNGGDAFAKTLGINVQTIRILTLVIVSIIAAGIVSFTGVIGFIGMVAPHICRMFVGSDNKMLIPSAMALGAALTVFSDIIARVVITTQVPIGIITSIIGGPLFLFLVLRQSKEVW
ncbi:MAG: iron ABC transporter permease [archaeon]|nr:iron ABC transporter permease [archaeon]